MRISPSRNVVRFSVSFLVALALVAAWFAWQGDGAAMLAPWGFGDDRPSRPPPPPPPPALEDGSWRPAGEGKGTAVGKPEPANAASAVDLTIPAKMKIIALVFYGRWELVRILDCYLKVPGPHLL